MRNSMSLKNKQKIHNAVIEMMERRTLFTAAPVTLDPAFGTNGYTLQLQSAAANDDIELTATDPVNGNVFEVANGNIVEEFTSAGKIVPSFGSNGLLIATPHGFASDGVAVQTDGKLLVCNDAYQDGQTVLTLDIYLTRYTAAGNPDPTFGTGGTLSFATQNSIDVTSSDQFTLLGNGNIAFFGSVVGSNDVPISSVTVYTPAGMLDTAFGTDGTALGAPGVLQGLTLDSSGKLVGVGSAWNSSAMVTTSGLLERFTSAGKLDTTFGNKGSIAVPNAAHLTSVYTSTTAIATAGYSSNASGGILLELNHFTPSGQIDTSFDSGKGYVSPVFSAPIGYNFTFEPDGKLLASATIGGSSTDIGDTALIRLNTNGSLDTTFGSAGYDDLGSSSINITSDPSLESDGQIVLPSQTTDGLDFRPLRLLANGSADPTFGIGGYGVGRTLFTTADAIADLPDGQTLVAGELSVGDIQGSYIERFNANGSLDPTFAPGEGYGGQNGYIFGDAQPLPPDVATTVDGLQVDSSGRIYLDQAGVGIVRYTASGQLDKSFGTDGTYQNTNADGLLLESDGQILVSAGSNSLRRLNSNGQLDKTFGTAGTAALPAAFSQNAGVLAVQPNGDIVIGGSTNDTQLESQIIAVVRLESNGTLDTPFGTAGMAIANLLPEENQVDSMGSYSAASGAVAVLPNGNILLAGSGGLAGRASVGQIGPTLAEFLPNGKLNSSFGTGGQTSAFILPADNESDGSASSLVVQSDGSFVVAGTENVGGQPFMSSNSLVIHYAAKGTVDSYLTNNFAPNDPNTQFGPYSTINATVAGPNGTLIAVGSISDMNDGGPQGPVLARYITAPNTITGTLTGTPIGTAGSYQNQGNTLSKVFDGNPSTFYDAPTASGCYVGLDLGSQNVITQISYAPRPGFAYRMDGGIFQASNSATFTSGDATLFTITGTPPTGVLTTVAITNAAAYRFVRYVGPANSYCNIAEMQIARTTQAAVIGTAGSYDNHGNTIANVFDGNLTTFFDAPTASGSWVGLDLGSAQAITQVSFAPRPGFTTRMVGGEIQASNSANFSSGVVTAYTITTVPPAGALTTVTFASAGAYRYWRYIGPTGSYCNLSELEFNEA